MKKLFGFAAALALFFSPVGSQAAWSGLLHPERWEFRAGYAYQYKNTKARPHNFQLINFMLSGAYPLGGQKNFGWLTGRFEWAPELWLGIFTHPYYRGLFNANPLQFRYVFQPEGKIRPYLFAGAGILYADVDRRETGNRINFNPQFGSGFYFTLNEKTSLILEYRHVHISNAGLDDRNSGMNNHTFLAGVSFKS